MCETVDPPRPLLWLEGGIQQLRQLFVLLFNSTHRILGNRDRHHDDNIPAN